MSYERTVAAMEIDDHSFATTLSVHELLDLVVPGRAFLPKAKNDPVTERIVQSLTPFHDRIQRDLSGRKLTNAKGDLKDYVLSEWIPEEGTGILPPFVIWFSAKIQVNRKEECRPLSHAVMPAGCKALLLDGESRVEACLYALAEAEDSQVQLLLGKRVSVLALHNVQVEKAAKWFADINGKGVGVNPNLLMSRDFKDPWAIVALDVFRELDVPLEMDKRQVNVRSPAVITAMQARTMVAAIGIGLTAITYGAKRIPTKDSKGRDLVDWPRLEKAAKEWLRDVFSRFNPAAVKDRERVLRSVPVLVSIGAIGRGVYLQTENGLESAKTFLSDDSINWARGEHWAGIAGKLNARGTFSVGSGKENAYATFRALTDPEDPGYWRIRHQGRQRALDLGEPVTDARVGL